MSGRENTDPDTAAERDRVLPAPREALRAWAELAGLWSLAIAYPVLIGSTSGAEGLTSVRADRFDVVAFAILIVAIAPTVMIAFEVLIGLWSTGIRRATHGLFLGLLTGVFVLRALVDAGVVGRLGLLAALATSLAIAWLYLRSRFLQTMAGILTVATPVVLIAFALSGPVLSLFTPEGESANVSNPEDRPPVVMVIFDEFPLASIESRPGAINAGLLPGFARLSRESTWYSNARTQSDSTNLALPALLTGALPVDPGTPPGQADYPDNLFSILSRSGYEVYGSEWITDLCPHDVCARTRGFGARMARLTANGLTTERPVPLPRERDLTLTSEFRETRDPRPTQPERVEEFIDELENGEADAEVLHLMLPHVPWVYLPDGRSHNGPPILTEFSQNAGERRQEIQRMMLQTAYVDAAVTRMVNAMKASGTWEETLFILVADHGATMGPDGSRRVATTENEGWIVPVPLFIKYPDQERGRAVKDTVLTTDIVPTVLAQLGSGPDSDALPRTAGRSGPERFEVKTTLAGNFTVEEEELRRKFRRHVHTVSGLFPGMSLYATGGHPSLLGQETSTAKGLRPLDFQLDSPELYENVDLDSEPVPAYVSGRPADQSLPSGSSLAISLNGTIAATVRPWERDGSLVFGTVVDPATIQSGKNGIELFLIAPY